MSWSRDEVSAFVAEEPRLGRLGTASADGVPHVAPIWFAERDGAFLVHTLGETRKAGNVRENGRFALTVDEPEPPYKGVTLHGSARFADEGEVDWKGLLGELAVRYLGDEQGPGYAEYIANIPGEHVTLVLDPDGRSDWDYSQA